MQYSDYDKIALGHAQYIDFAVKYANKVAFIDTDLSLPGVLQKYEGREHPFVQALIDEYRFDHSDPLENNTPWVADGLRSLGSSVDRKEFQNLLVNAGREQYRIRAGLKRTITTTVSCAAWSWCRGDDGEQR